MFEVDFGFLINTKEDAHSQFKKVAEDIKFKDDPKLLAKPTGNPSDSSVLYWTVCDEDNKQRAEVVFTRLSYLENNFVVEDNVRRKIDPMRYYSVKVKANQEVFIQ